MGNFNDFLNSENNEKNNISAQMNNNYNNNYGRTNEKLEEMINDYSKLSNNELMNEFIRLTIEKKKKGQLSNLELEGIKKTILPYLNSDQKNMLEKLLEMVENV